MSARALLLPTLLLLACDKGDDSGHPAPPYDDLQWSLHAEIESLVTVDFELSEAAEAWVEFRPVGDTDWLLTPARTLEPGPASFLLLGIPYASDFDFRVVVDRGDGPELGDELPGTTGPLPGGLPLPALLEADAEGYDSAGRFLFTSVNDEPGGWVSGDFWKVIVDREGRVVWALLTPDHMWTTYVRVSENGQDLLYDAFSFWYLYDGGARSTVHRMDITGSELHSYATPGAQHAFVDLPDGSVAWGAMDVTHETLEVVDTAGEQRTLWSCAEFFDARGLEGGCASNSLSWDAATDSYLFSIYTNNTLVQVDANSGETLRVFGEDHGDYAFDPEHTAFWWQHGAVLTPTGTLLLSTHTLPEVMAADQETVAREYAIDDGAMVLEQVASFGVGSGLNGENAGEAHRLANGNTLHNTGTGGRIREYTPSGEVVWDLDWGQPGWGDPSTARLVGRGVLLEDLYAFAP